MSTSFVRLVGALGAAAVVTISAVAGAAPAGAVVPSIHTPTLTVVCSKPHHGTFYSAVRFRQHGRWAAGSSVIVTLAPGKGDHIKAEMHTKTRADGTFRLRRTLHSENTGPWVAGAIYSWTTAVYAKSAAMARRGTVTLTGSC
jgi:hypothetical protein